VNFGERVFTMLVEAGLDLKVAHLCDIGRSLWFWAAQEGHVDALRLFLDAGFPIDLRATRTGYHTLRERAVAPLFTTALWNSAFRGHIDCVDLFLKAGASVCPSEVERQELQQIKNGSTPKRLTEDAHIESGTNKTFFVSIRPGVDTLVSVFPIVPISPDDLLGIFSGRIRFSEHCSVVQSIVGPTPSLWLDYSQVTGTLNQMRVVQPGGEANVRLAWEGINENVENGPCEH
jgi:Ankyrin repeats (many copies)